MALKRNLRRIWMTDRAPEHIVLLVYLAYLVDLAYTGSI